MKCFCNREYPAVGRIGQFFLNFRNVDLLAVSYKTVHSKSNRITSYNVCYTKLLRNLFDLRYQGDFEKVEKALSKDYTIISHSENEKDNLLKVQYNNGNSNNKLLETLLPLVEIIV